MDLKKFKNKRFNFLKSLSAKDITWMLFTITGNIGYYLMHRELNIGNEKINKPQTKAVREA